MSGIFPRGKRYKWFFFNSRWRALPWNFIKGELKSDKHFFFFFLDMMRSLLFLLLKTHQRNETWRCTMLGFRDWNICTDFCVYPAHNRCFVLGISVNSLMFSNTWKSIEFKYNTWSEPWSQMGICLGKAD